MTDQPPRAIRSRRLPRCAGCGLSLGLCVCAGLPRLSTRSELLLVVHRKEHFKSTNTGKLAARMLERAAYCVRDGRAAGEPPAPTPGSWVLFPGPRAVPLREAMERGVSRLIVPDGTWQQASRIARRDPACASLPCVRVEAAASSYRLRRNARAGGLCTLEAIAAALRTLEGDAPADALLRAFESWLARAQLVRAGAHELRVPGVEP